MSWSAAHSGPAARPIRATRLGIARTGQDLQMYGYPRKVYELSWDEDGRFCFWRPSRNKKLLAQRRIEDGGSHLSWSPDDRGLALGNCCGELTVAEVA